MFQKNQVHGGKEVICLDLKSKLDLFRPKHKVAADSKFVRGIAPFERNDVFKRERFNSDGNDYGRRESRVPINSGITSIEIDVNKINYPLNSKYQLNSQIQV